MNYEEVKITHKEILRKNSERILTKDLVITHHIESVSWNDDDVIRKYHETKISEHLKVKKTEDLVWWKCNLWNCCEKV